jgi:hypothetical protein
VEEPSVKMVSGMLLSVAASFFSIESSRFFKAAIDCLLLHPNPVFCQSSHECMSQPDRDVICPNRGKSSNDLNISTLKDLSINLCME